MCLDIAKRFSMARVTNDITTTDKFWSSMVLRFMRYCYCRRGALPIRRARGGELYHTSYNKRGAVSAAQALSLHSIHPPTSQPSTKHAKCNFMLNQRSRSRGVGDGRLLRTSNIWHNLRKNSSSDFLAETRRQIILAAIERRSCSSKKVCVPGRLRRLTAADVLAET